MTLGLYNESTVTGSESLAGLQNDWDGITMESDLTWISLDYVVRLNPRVSVTNDRGRTITLTKPLHQSLSGPYITQYDTITISKLSTTIDRITVDYPNTEYGRQLFAHDIERWLTPRSLARFEEELFECLLKKGWERVHHYRGITTVKGYGKTLPLRMDVRSVGTPTVTIVTDRLDVVYAVYDSSKLANEIADVLDQHWRPDVQERITEKINTMVRDSLKGFIGEPITASAMRAMQKQVTDTLFKSVDQNPCKEIALTDFRGGFRDSARNLQAFKQMWAEYAAYQFEPVKEYTTPDWVITPKDRQNTRYFGTDIFSYYDDDL